MPTTLELCEKYFQTTDIYELLGVTKDSLEKDSKSKCRHFHKYLKKNKFFS